MKNGVFTLDWGSFAESAVSAIFVAVLVAVGGLVLAPNFDVFSVDFGALLHTMVNVSIVTFFGVLMKEFVSDNSGKVFGITGTNN